jgi:hypothetical protein
LRSHQNEIKRAEFCAIQNSALGSLKNESTQLNQVSSKLDFQKNNASQKTTTNYDKLRQTTKTYQAPYDYIYLFHTYPGLKNEFRDYQK